MDSQEQLPDHLRGNQLGTFAHHSVAVRLPEIASRVLVENQLTAKAHAAIKSLIDEIADGVIQPLTGRGPDGAAWDEHVTPHLGRSWLDVPWFFAELYFYRRILDAVDYWETGSDPYRSQKQLGLAQALAPSRSTLEKVDAGYARGVSTDFLLLQLTDAALWGNQVDLSLWPTAADGHAQPDHDAERLIVDERPEAIRTLRDRTPPTVDVVVDNAGLELVSDLLVVDLLLRSDLASTVRLHAKQYPIFVSDATPRDVAETIRHMAADSNPHLRNAGERLRIEFAADRLQVVADPFWVSPLEWRDRPQSIETVLADTGLIIIKGDASYRRLLGDRLWSYSVPFAVAIGSTPAPLLALRTLKSEVASGLPQETVARLDASDENWMKSGRWALASFATPRD